MCNGSLDKYAHPTYPLTSQALQQLSLTPDFVYLDTQNARTISDRLRASSSYFTPSEITATGLLGRIYLHIIDIYSDNNPGIFSDLDLFLSSQNSTATLNTNLKEIITYYPTSKSYYSPEVIPDYLFETSNKPDHRYSLYKSIILFMSAENNLPIRQRDGVFTDAAIISSTSYSQLSGSFRAYFQGQPIYMGSGLSLLDFLDSPAKAHPASLEAQLNYIYCYWGDFLGRDYLNAILRALDHIREETTLRSTGPGTPENPLGYFRASYLSDIDQVRFSPDKDWMPNLVLIAKNIYVWLDQLSKKYARSITTIAQIPDEELAQLSSWGFTGLWLIGLWERSSASQRIKQICGNPDAAPSAYSLYDYSIASVLGGESAYLDLAARARSYNIRLAADMVPNHMGVYSNWIINYPDRFLSLGYSPFPSYTFSGPNLSKDHRIGIYLEDHYYSQDDAAVVFKRVDHQSGAEQYIYHGNDGTSMPWNDTAQLDFLNPETRESVIQSILSVAKKFPIIRFDAAMTLTKKHFHRLWYPEPGSGGAIPTRSDYGLTKTEFDRACPNEFWQEVVDRIAKDSPDTLLLAEAFWMMEGYFVRTLGMHRVYNSAFMHMLREEDNKQYRSLIIQTLEYDPQILKRYVNFMNNPDEETAISQFGSDGKYFGICVLMATLPGLPMFGHGQIEGYEEKYGMEYRRAYYDEQPNHDLIDRHSREIFPLLKLREVFADVAHFHLFDVLSNSGELLNDVIAYTNYSESGKALVVYHNAWKEIAGSIHSSSPVNGQFVSLLDALGFTDPKSGFILFRDHITGLEYIRSINELSASGLEISLGAYEYQVFLDFEFVEESEDLYEDLHKSLKGSGVENLQYSMAEIKYKTLLDDMLNISKEIIKFEIPSITSPKILDPQIPESERGFQERVESIIELLPSIKSFPPMANEIDKTTQSINPLFNISEHFAYLSKSGLMCFAISYLLTDFPVSELSLILDLFKNKLKGMEIFTSKDLFLLVKVSLDLIKFQSGPSLDLNSFVDYWFENPSVADFISINDFEGITWFHKESMQILVDFSLFHYLINQLSSLEQSDDSYTTLIKRILQIRQEVQYAISQSNYQVENLKSLLPTN